MGDDQVPPPADFLGHARYLEEQAQDIEALHERLRGAEDAPTRRAGFRLDDIAVELRRVARELQETAEDRRVGLSVGGYDAIPSSSSRGGVWVKSGCQRWKSSARVSSRTRVRT